VKKSANEKKYDISKGPFWSLIGMKIICINDRGCLLELKVQKKNLHSHGRVHGGVIASLIDSSIGFAAHHTIPAGLGTNTSQLSVNYLRPVEMGETIRASAELIHCGKITVVGICDVSNQKGEKIAHGTAVMIVKPVDILYKRQKEKLERNDSNI
jgi:acyl-CoA thioesterase